MNEKEEDTDFELTLEQLNLMVGKTADYIKTIADFSGWCATSIEKEGEENIDLKACYYIFEDFVKSNEHIIQKINHYNNNDHHNNQQ